MSSYFLISTVAVCFPSLVTNTLCITPQFLQLDSFHSAQCLAVFVCFCFSQLLAKGSRMAYKVVINLIIWEGHLGQPLHYSLECYLWSSLYMSGHFPNFRKTGEHVTQNQLNKAHRGSEKVSLLSWSLHGSVPGTLQTCFCCLAWFVCGIPTSSPHDVSDSFACSWDTSFY